MLRTASNGYSSSSDSDSDSSLLSESSLLSDSDSSSNAKKNNKRPLTQTSTTQQIAANLNSQTSESVQNKRQRLSESVKNALREKINTTDTIIESSLNEVSTDIHQGIRDLNNELLADEQKIEDIKAHDKEIKKQIVELQCLARSCNDVKMGYYKASSLFKLKANQEHQKLNQALENKSFSCN